MSSHSRYSRATSLQTTRSIISALLCRTCKMDEMNEYMTKNDIYDTLRNEMRVYVCGNAVRFYIRDENLQCLRAVIEREFTFFHFALLFFENCECIQVLVRRICTCTRLLEYDSNFGVGFDKEKIKKN